MSSILERVNDDLASVMESAHRSLVQVQNHGGSGGAGTIWHPGGLIITNAHVVRTSSPRVVLSDGRTMKARVLARDVTHDLAALSVDSDELPVVELGRSRDLKPGEVVLSVGHPWGVVGSVTAGVVIGLESDWVDRSAARREWIAVSLHLRPGYSGGPLLDVHGRLVGVNTMMNGPDVGIAVPVHEAKRFLRNALGD